MLSSLSVIVCNVSSHNPLRIKSTDSHCFVCLCWKQCQTSVPFAQELPFLNHSPPSYLASRSLRRAVPADRTTSHRRSKILVVQISECSHSRSIVHHFSAFLDTKHSRMEIFFVSLSVPLHSNPTASVAYVHDQSEISFYW